ncbi:bifunctional metallophosphatase/5'-nucleotidase [Marinicella sediminis]|nr:metallophosphoesterase [Marinicella sediminis]
MSINDVYRIAGIDEGRTGGLARVRALRTQLMDQYDHVLFLHAGDFLHPSFISKQDNGTAMIQTLNMMDGLADVFDEQMVVTWGNHEFDKGGMKHVPLMNQLLDQSEFVWLGSNINWKPGSLSSARMRNQLLLQFGDIKVGIFSHTTGMAHPEYIDSFGDYPATARQFVPQLRSQGADLVIGLTHQWLQDDLAMMKLPDEHRPDMIFGGHEHYVQTEQVDGHWVLKADADAASAIVAEVVFSEAGFSVTPAVVELGAAFPEDPPTAQLIQQLVRQTDRSYCQQRQLPDDCLYQTLGMTQTQLIAEETEIRRFETNLGNVLADLVMTTFASCQADVVLLNSGSIRLNQNIPAGASITVKHLEEMFPYPSDLRLIEFDSGLFQSILNHSISSWTANGHWLQIAGFAYIHNPVEQTASHVHLKKHDSTTLPDTIRAVVPYYLIAEGGDQDGYTMLNESMQQACSSNGTELKQLMSDYLPLLPNGLNARRDFRICNTSRDDCM